MTQKQRLSCAFLGLAVCAGCGSAKEPTRTWQASDHAQPPVDAQSVAQSAQGTAGQHGLSAGAEVWGKYCASCHGDQAKGDGQTMKVPFDFTTPDWQKKMSDEQIAQVIRSGRNAMPPFSDLLGDMEVRALIQWIRAQEVGQK